MEPDRATLRPNPYESPRASFPRRPHRRFRAATFLSFVLPFAVPFVSYAAYQPINHDWTVEHFGCACPRLDGTYRPFNANHFNAILWGGVLIGCLSWWIPSARRVLPQTVRMPGCLAGGVVMTWICVAMWLRCGWL